MSVISSFEVDNSAALAKRFASLVGDFFEHPAVAKEASSRVPLENVYRMLEMFRYDSFADESRRGVLALQSPEAKPSFPLNASDWHTSISDALTHALTEAFGNAQKDEALDQLQDSLRWLINGDADLSQDTLHRAQRFFAAFEARV